MDKHIYPYIETIDDVMDVINPDLFYIADKGDYKIINYMVNCAAAFPTIFSKTTELRGITFDSSGKIIRRTMQKFFNINEKDDTSFANIDLSKPHVVMEKLDGTMIAPFIIDTQVIWGTKLGDTDQAKDVLNFVLNKSNYNNFVHTLNDCGYTAIFEYTSPNNRIVLDYATEALTLLAIRKIKSGEYLSIERQQEYAKWFNIPHVTVYSDKLSLDFVEKIQKRTHGEGVVVRFHDGVMIKIKCEDYVRLHKIKSEFNSERNVVNLIISEKIDDLKALLPKSDVAKISKFEEIISEKIVNITHDVDILVKAIIQNGMSRKDFALLEFVPPYLKQIIFKAWENTGDKMLIVSEIRNAILRQCISNKKYLESKNSGNILEGIPNWAGLMFVGDDA